MTRRDVPDMKDKTAYTKWLMEVWPGNGQKKHGCFGCDISKEFLVPFLCDFHLGEWLQNSSEFEVLADHLSQDETSD